MKHLDFTPTPVTSLPYYSEKFGCQLLCKRDDLLDILKGKNVYKAIEDFAITCPDEEAIGDYKCLGAQDSCYCCEECWKRILNI